MRLGQWVGDDTRSVDLDRRKVNLRGVIKESTLVEERKEPTEEEVSRRM